MRWPFAASLWSFLEPSRRVALSWKSVLEIRKVNSFLQASSATSSEGRETLQSRFPTLNLHSKPLALAVARQVPLSPQTMRLASSSAALKLPKATFVQKVYLCYLLLLDVSNIKSHRFVAWSCGPHHITFSQTHHILWSTRTKRCYGSCSHCIRLHWLPW